MRVLVTGAGGFIGKRLVRELAEQGDSVYALLRKPPTAADAIYFADSKVHQVVRDLGNLDTASLPTGIDALVTLGQSSRFREFPEQAEEVFGVNVTANLRLLQWAVETGVRRVVHASSGGIYGGKRGGQFLESDLLAVDSPLGFYLGTKLCGEVLVQNYRQFFDTTVILRPFFVYGPGQRHDMFVARLIESVRHGRPISLQGVDGLRVNPIYVDDAVACFRSAVGLEGAHVINIAGPDVLTLRQICDSIGQLVRRSPVYQMLSGDPIDYVADLTRTRELLKPAPSTPFMDGVRRSVLS